MERVDDTAAVDAAAAFHVLRPQNTALSAQLHCDHERIRDDSHAILVNRVLIRLLLLTADIVPGGRANNTYPRSVGWQSAGIIARLTES